MQTFTRIVTIAALVTLLSSCSESSASIAGVAEPTHGGDRNDSKDDGGKDDEGGDVDEPSSGSVLTCVQRQDKPRGPVITTKPPAPAPTPTASKDKLVHAKEVFKAFGPNATTLKTVARFALPHQDGRKSKGITEADRAVLEGLARYNIEAVLVSAFETSSEIKVCERLCAEIKQTHRGKACVAGSRIEFAAPIPVPRQPALVELPLSGKVEVGCGCEK